MVWIFLTVVLVFFVVDRTFRHVMYGLAAFASVALVVVVLLYTHATRPQPITPVAGRDLSQELCPAAPNTPTTRTSELVQAVSAPPRTPDGKDPYAREARARLAQLRQRLQHHETTEERWQRLMRQSRQP